MTCELCQFNEYGQKNTAEVSYKDGYGKIHYVCEGHAVALEDYYSEAYYDEICDNNGFR